ncbi:MAG: hypothetical protein AABZ08_07565 [Planctomycetota bacterium]
MPVKPSHSQPQSLRHKGITKIELLLTVLMIALLIVFLQISDGAFSRTASRRAECLANLGSIGKAIQSYLTDNGHRWPHVAKLASVKTDAAPWPTMPEVLAKHTGGNPNIFRCPADRRTLTTDTPLRNQFSVNTTYYQTEGTSYEWWFGEAYAGKKVGEESLGKSGGFGMGRADQPLLSDFEPFHTGDDLGAINTLNADLKPRTSRARSSGAR